MKRRIAVISSCPPPLPGHPATGGGLRTWQLVETLKEAGHAVHLLIEAEALPDDAPKALRKQAFVREELAAQLDALRPSVVVVEQWALAAHLGSVERPCVIDLHGSLILENVYRRGELDLVLDAGTKIDALRRADLLLVPAEAQRHHFAAWATLAGFDPRELPIAVLPLAWPGEATRPRRNKKPPLRMVYGGARWPWIDSLEALGCAADVVESLPDARLDLFTYDPPRHGLPVDEDLGTWTEVDAVLAGREAQGITCHGRTEHAAFANFLATTATVALDLWVPNAERMLAATTRTVEYLGCGLPVITVEGSAWGEVLLASGAGWTVPAGNTLALEALLRELSDHPERITEASAAARKRITERHSLEAAGVRLVAFCKKPSRAPRAPGSLVDTLLRLRRTQVDEELQSLKKAHQDEHEALVARHLDSLTQEQKRSRTEVEALVEQHRVEVDTLREAHRKDTDRIVAEHQEQSAQALREQTEILTDRDLQHSEAVALLSARHRSEIEALADANRIERSEAEAQGRETLQAQRKELQTELETQSKNHKGERKQAESEQRKTTEVLVDRHRHEVEELVSEWQQRAKSIQSSLDRERIRNKEEKARIEVDLQQRISARELELRTEMERREAELLAALEEATAGVVHKIRQKVGALGEDVGDLLPGRAGPAARLARLWVSHAADAPRPEGSETSSDPEEN